MEVKVQVGNIKKVEDLESLQSLESMVHNNGDCGKEVKKCEAWNRRRKESGMMKVSARMKVMKV